MKATKENIKLAPIPQLRTDMALEFGADIKTDYADDIVKRSAVTVDEEFAKKIGKPVGNYITIETSSVKSGMRHEFSRVSSEIAKTITQLTKARDILIVGLGNPDMTSDSLGKRVLDKVMITRHMDMGKKIITTSGIYPNVFGVTGVESFDIIKGTVSRTKPDVVIAIDSLAGATVARLASAFQLSDSGITPGSGISNHRQRLDAKSLGRPVISIGVPLVVYATTIINDAVGEECAKGLDEFDDDIKGLVVTPKDIDLLVVDCAEIIAKAINLAFFGEEF